MVSNAGPDDAVQVTSLEWRRHFYRVGSGPALVGCVVASLIAIIGFTGAVLAAAQWDSHNAVVLIWAGTGLFGSGMAASLIFQSQILPPAMNTVSISNGVTVVRSAGECRALSSCPWRCSDSSRCSSDCSSECVME